jgi:hypothetical protein
MYCCWRSRYQEERVRIPLTGLTPPQFCACPKAGPGFPTSFLHSIQCGAGTGMFLLVNSSTVVVIRGPRATLWGSIYLDDHGEEDRELKYVYVQLDIHLCSLL